MNQHTKTPWHVTRSSVGMHHYVEARIGGGLVQEIASCGPTEGPEGSEGNAEFIVRACNAHDELVAALQVLIRRIEHYSSLDTDARPNIEQWEYTEGSADMQAARDAVAKAVGSARSA